MKVKDLIAELQQFNPDLMVIRSGYEGGYAEATHVSEETIALNVNESWYYGPHETIDEYDQHEGHERVQAVYVR